MEGEAIISSLPVGQVLMAPPFRLSCQPWSAPIAAHSGYFPSAYGGLVAQSYPKPSTSGKLRTWVILPQHHMGLPSRRVRPQISGI